MFKSNDDIHRLWGVGFNALLNFYNWDDDLIDTDLIKTTK
jgi:hypothetical protein